MERPDAEPAEHRVDQSGTRIEKLQQKSHEHDERYEVRRIRNHLNRVLEAPILHIVETERQNNGKREARQQGIKTDHQRVPQQSPKFVRMKKTFKLRKPYPWTASDAFGYVEFLERNLCAVHRHVLEYNDVEQRQSKQRVQLPFARDVLPKIQPGHPLILICISGR